MHNLARFMSNAGTGAWLEAASSPKTEEKTAFTMAAWYKPAELVTGTIIGIGKSAATGYMALAMTNEGKAFIEATNASISTSKLTVNTWGHFGAVGNEGGTAMASFLNGVRSGNVNNGSQVAFNRLTIGALIVNGSLVSQAKGFIAHPAIWNVELTQQEMESLAAGLPPFLVRPSALIFYAPLYNPTTTGNETDLIAGLGLTLKGTTSLAESGEGPPKFYLPDPPFVSIPAVAGGKALTLELTDAVKPAEARGAKDQMKRADALASVSEARSKRPGLVRKDSQALADALKRAVGERRTDTLALADALRRVAGDKRVDSVAFADKLAKALGVRRADAQVIVDVLRRRAGTARSDSFAVGEKHQAAPGVRRQDSVGPTDSLKRTEAQRKADALVVVELLAHAWHARRSLGDAVPLDDHFLVFLGRELEFADTAALKDALAHAWAAHSGLADHLSPTEARKLRSALRRADTASVVAVIHNNAGPSRNDSFSLTDARRLAAGKGLAETVSLVDAVKLIPHHVLGTGDMAVLAAAVSRAWAAKLARADSFGMTDVARRAAGRHLAEHFALGDSRSASWKALRSAQDMFGLVDAVETFSSKGSNPNEHVHVTDALERAWHAVFSRAEALSAADSHQLGFANFLHESVNLPETHLRSLAKHFALQVGLAEQLQRAISRRQSDSLGLSSASSKRLQKTLHELVELQDSRGTRYAEAFLEALDLADHQARATGVSRRDQITVAEARRLGLIRPLHEGIQLGERLGREYTVRLRDAVLPLEFRVRSMGLGRHESMSVTDAIDVFRVLGVILDEALGIADGLRRDSVLALQELTELEDAVEPHGHAAHLAVLALADFLQTQTSLEDAAETLAEVADRCDTTLQVEDA